MDSTKTIIQDNDTLFSQLVHKWRPNDIELSVQLIFNFSTRILFPWTPVAPGIHKRAK